LIVHSDPSTLALLASMLKSLEHTIEEAANDRVAVRLLERGGVDLVLAGVDPADPEGLELLAYMRRKHRQVPMIVLFASANLDRAREALRMGALTVLKYPVPASELRAAVTQALGPIKAQPSAPLASAAPAAPPVASAPVRVEVRAKDLGIIGTDPSLRHAVELAASIAPTRSPVLIIGEPGTGKSLLARSIHSLGTRGDHPFVVLDCQALCASNTENADAHAEPESDENPIPADWLAKLAQAQGGTLFLSEVSALSEPLQAELLHALQGREFEHTGFHGGAHTETRILLSTSENLLALVEQGKFRQDLYHRISVICLKLPPLRHRVHDVEPLAEHFRVKYATEFGKNIAGFTRDALEALHKYEWPGNVHELEGVIQRGVVLCQGSRITSGHLAPALGGSRASRITAKTPRPHLSMSIRPLKEALEEPEKRIIIQALQALNWNRQETARVLDINRTTLYKKMKKYGLLVDGPIWVN
jgi:two-component system response regulator HydG